MWIQRAAVVRRTEHAYPLAGGFEALNLADVE
jgi:hypothetical protein